MIQNISSEGKEYVIRQINNFDKTNSDDDIIICLLNNFNKNEIINETNNIIEISTFKSNSVDFEIYSKFKSIIDLEFNNYISFNENIIKKHNLKKIIKRKQLVTDLLLKLHEEIQFKLNIILKVYN